MLILSYILGAIVFLLVEVLVATICLSVYTILVGSFQKGLAGNSTANTHFLNQLFSTIIAIIVGVYIGLMVFNWFNKTPNFYIFLSICFVVWYITNSKIDQQFKPKAQRLGAAVGVVISYLINCY